jgi:N-acetylglucosaminyldiphosphoundecaprenol N-acetyl-beta-D-mannosaminyltransferase
MVKVMTSAVSSCGGLQSVWTEARGQSSLFVSWEPYNSRSEALATAFGAECRNVHYLALKRPLIAPLKYILQTIKTWAILRAEKPDFIFVQNPPVFAPLAVLVYAKLAGVPYAIDSHTGAFLEKKWTWLSPLHKFVARRAEVNIVTNDHLGQMLRDWGADYFVIGDIPMKLEATNRRHEGHDVTVVNSFSYDEPLAEILEAARRLPDINFSITGDTKRCSRDTIERAPANVSFTGFVSREQYLSILSSSRAALVLTKENHTMQRGAYEAMSLGVPIVTSDWPLLRDTFFRGAAFTNNSIDSIVAALRDVLNRNWHYRAEVATLKAERETIWASRLETFRDAHTERLRKREAKGLAELTTAEVLGLNINLVSFSEAVKLVFDLIDERRPQTRYVLTPNVNHIVLASRSDRFRAAYADADLVLADGRYVLLLARLLGAGLREPVNGSDLVPALLEQSKIRGGLRLFLLGAAEGVGVRAAERIARDFPWVEIVGVISPPMGFDSSAEETERVLQAINSVSPELLVVGISPPRQEIWVHEHADRIHAGLCICAGATIDFLAGAKPRAPVLMQQAHLEWVFRVLLEPRRLGPRYFRDGLAIIRLLFAELLRRASRKA